MTKPKNASKRASGRKALDLAGQGSLQTAVTMPDEKRDASAPEGKLGRSKKTIKSVSRMPLPRREYKALHRHYGQTLRKLQIELVKLQKEVISKERKILVLVEGRDAGGKDGAIKRITEHLSSRETRVVALPKPSDREHGEWYFQRYVRHLPSSGEIVLFNRSWYNRAGVERVMGFCTNEEYESFFGTVNAFEHMLIESGVKLFKYYLDISNAEQEQRLDARRKDPLKQWKISPIDAVAHEKWVGYSKARNAMFARSHTPWAPWTVVSANDKKAARLNLIKDLLMRSDYKNKNEELCLPDPRIVFTYDEICIENGMIAP